MRPSEYYAQDTQAMIPKSTLPSFRQDTVPASHCRRKLTQAVTAASEVASSTSVTAEQVKKFDVAH